MRRYGNEDDIGLQEEREQGEEMGRGDKERRLREETNKEGKRGERRQGDEIMRGNEERKQGEGRR